MAKFRKWIMTVDQKKQYKQRMGTTDYDTPMFGCKVIHIAAMVVRVSLDSSNLRFDSSRLRWPLSHRRPIAGFSVAPILVT